MSNAKRTVNVNKRKRTEGDTVTEQVYDGSIVLDTPTEEEPVTLADVQALLEDVASENNIPLTAKVVQGATLSLQWTDADLEP
jgi:hypothetical protein